METIKAHFNKIEDFDLLHEGYPCVMSIYSVSSFLSEEKLVSFIKESDGLIVGEKGLDYFISFVGLNPSDSILKFKYFLSPSEENCDSEIRENVIPIPYAIFENGKFIKHNGIFNASCCGVCLIVLTKS